MDEIKNAVREMVESQTGLKVTHVYQVYINEWVAECENGEKYIVH